MVPSNVVNYIRCVVLLRVVTLTLIASLSLFKSTPLPSGHDHANVIPVQQNALQILRRFFPAFLISIVLDRVFQHAIHVHVESFQSAGEFFVSVFHDYPDFLVDAFVHEFGREEEGRVVRCGGLFRR